MKFTTQTKDFLKVINTAIKAVPAKSAFPMMENFLLSVKDNRLYVTATDGSLTIESNTDAEGEGETCINAKLLLDAVALLPDGNIELEVVDNVAHINYGKGNFNLPCFPVSDYPSVNVDIPGDATVISNGSLKSALKYVLPSIATDPIRPAMTGVYFNPTEKGYDIVASDAHSLSLEEVECEVKTGDFILPANAAKFLQASVPDDFDTTLVYVSESSVSFYFEHTVVNTVKIVGKFPKYREVIPANNGNRLTAKVADLLGVVKRVSTCANKASQTIKLVLSTFGGATMEAQDLGFGCSAKEEMEDIVYNGSEMTIGFKSDLLTNLLSALGEEDVIVDMDSPRRAVLLTTNNESRKAILMPVAVE